MEGINLSCLPRLPPQNKKDEVQVARPLAQYHPSIWGDYFIHSVAPPDQERHEWMKQRVEKLKEEVRRMLVSACGDLVEEMNLVDTLQRLGLGYHLEQEISDSLVRIHDHQPADDENLHVVSLRFRLLRQNGYNVSSDQFNKFRDVDGKFQRDLCSDVKGLLSFYEAAYLRTHDDIVLDEAVTFCRGQLETMISYLPPLLLSEVARSLETPLFRRMQRLEARQYISIYEASEGRNDVILELAKLDFNLLQSLHQEEIKVLSMWWKELDLVKKLKFNARDRLVECYFWILSIFYEPHLHRARMMSTKIIKLLSLLDDIYDAYGTLDELQLFTTVIQRWDIDAVEELPEYMKIFFEAMDNIFKGFEDELTKEHSSYRMEFLREEIKMLSKAYHEEAKWRDAQHIPIFEDHLNVSLVSSGFNALICASFVGMGNIATKEAFNWVKSFPKIDKFSSMIVRLGNDIVSEFEKKRPHVASTVECYMKEYSVSKEQACQKICEIIEDSWKVIIQEYIESKVITLQLLRSPINLARFSEMNYKHKDGYTDSQGTTRNLINLLLVKCIPI